MSNDFFNVGKIKIKVNMLNPERLLNILWSNRVKILNVKRVDIATVIITAEYDDYEIIKDIVIRLGGKLNIVGSSGFLFFLGRLKKKASLVVGGFLFIAIILYLSTFIWRIEINTVKNVPPYEIRQQLYDIGIKPGIKKNSIRVKELEKKIEDVNSDVLWLRVRIEGATLKVAIEEKVNPPMETEKKLGNLVAKMDGKVERIYAFSGRAAIPLGTMVKEGDVIIEGISGKEEQPFEVSPNGVVMASTFYEKSMRVKVDGAILERSGRKDSDLYMNIFGKKIYLKKAIKDFKEYDKIEESGKILNKVVYFEREEVPVTLTEDEAVNNSVNELEESLLNQLTREARIVDKLVSTEKDSEGNLMVNVVFVVEQNIVNNVPIDYNVSVDD
ncbi:sporulation protein YqfD [Clostridium sp.]|uniref:sporulation protein YqfD n=1 Tax=Clostridium sp. TaxID=1506 RepID=UPI003F2C2D87